MNIIKSLSINKDTQYIQLPQLSPNDYQKAKGILARLEIEWHRERQVHVLGKKSFSKWVKYIETDRLPKLNPTAFFPTPVDVIELMLGEFFDEHYIDYLKEYRPNTLRILEPSAGVGAIAKAAREYFGESATTIDTVEYLPENCEALVKEGFTPFIGDFLDYSSDELYDIILTNPPFSLAGDKYAYITHVMHALSLLKPDGKLVAILPTGWLSQSNKRIDAFKELVAQYASWDFTQIIGSGAFKSSGTMVETMCICLEKNAPMNKEKEHCGWDTPAMWSFNLHSDALMSGCANACSLYDKTQEAKSYKQAKTAYTNFFKFAKNELAKKAMLYTESTFQRVIDRVISYEYDDESVISFEETENALFSQSPLDDKPFLSNDNFVLTPPIIGNTKKTISKRNKTTTAIKSKNTTQIRPGFALTELQEEFHW